MKTTNNLTISLPTNFIMPTAFDVYDDTVNAWFIVPKFALEILEVQDKISSQAKICGNSVCIPQGPDGDIFLVAYMGYLLETTGDIDFIVLGHDVEELGFIANLPVYES